MSVLDSSGNADPVGPAYAIGIADFLQGEYRSAQRWFVQALESPDLVQRSGPVWSDVTRAQQAEASLWNNLGLVYEVQNLYDLAGMAYGKSRFLELEIGNTHGAWTTAINEGLLHSRVDNLEQSRELLHGAHSYFDSIGDSPNAALALLNLAITESDDKRYDLAIEYVDQAIVLLTATRDSAQLKRAFITRGQLMGYEQNIPGLRESIAQLEQFNGQFSDAQADFFTTLLRAELKLQEGKPQVALAHIAQAEKQAPAQDNLWLNSNLFPLKLRAAHASQQDILFHSTLQDLFDTYTEVFNQERARNFAEMQELNERNEHMRTIEQLNLRVELEQKQNRKNFLIMLVISLMLSLTIWLYHTRLRGERVIFRLLHRISNERWANSGVMKAPDPYRASPPTIDTQSREVHEATRLKELYLALNKLVQEEELYLDPKMSISQVATRLGSNYTYLSAAINEISGTGFVDYLNALRIQKACDLLLDRQHHHLSFDQIGEMCGFQSTRTFYRQFKNFTNSTPGSFRKSAIKSKSFRT